ncbi:MAG TPA: histidine kinase dimerization/phospho-acceptor domain-containing protein [Burkholderiaceae bacterium]|nr:histidine kinase dimerization/phospho-acceptor domain-containing protein [Burkholderiaceae bacterium]
MDDGELTACTAVTRQCLDARPPNGVGASAVAAELRARQRQFEVRDLIERQREEAHRKDQFLDLLAHELRNPLATIRYAAHLLHLPDTPERKVAELGALIERQVGHMGRIFYQLLDVSRVTRGLIRVQRTTLDLARVAREAVVSQEVAAAARQVNIKGDISGLGWRWSRV